MGENKKPFAATKVKNKRKEILFFVLSIPIKKVESVSKVSKKYVIYQGDLRLENAVVYVRVVYKQFYFALCSVLLNRQFGDKEVFLLFYIRGKRYYPVPFMVLSDR